MSFKCGSWILAIALSFTFVTLREIYLEDYSSIDGTASSASLARRLLAKESEYPDNAISEQARRDGGIILYAVGCLYMFVALAIVCDEFFVPALEVLVEKYAIEEDVAGATFMAAGGSAPELFTSLIGVFIAKSNVGFGTIIGSAVFNVLFVIGMCALFSSEILALTWWPLARDCSFYTMDLVITFIFFWTGRTEDVLDDDGVKIGTKDIGLIEWWEALIMLCLYGLYVGFMKYNQQAEIFVKGLLGSKQIAPTDSSSAAGDGGDAAPGSEVSIMSGEVDLKEDGEEKKEKKEEEEEEDEEGLDLSWPEGTSARINYLLTAPIVYPLVYTLPNCKKDEGKRWFWITFFGSIMWIGFFSYWMVWWATEVGFVIGIPDEVMGLTFLAAGTSVPDLISSVIVARQGLGDMAVSSSIGSNIFDVTFGLPLPWFLWILINGKAYEVESESLAFSLVLLIIMLVAVVVIIASSGWKMTKALGFSMFLLYGVFLLLALLKTYNKLGALNDF